MKLLRSLLCLSIILPSSSFAFFCPTNFNQINFGDSIDQVTLMCGKPDKQTTQAIEAKVPQEWIYYIPQTVSTQTMQPQQGTLKTSVSFDADGNAINISVNGIGVGSSTICGGQPIALKNTTEQIKTACGTPAVINKQQLATPAATSAPNPENQMIEYSYNSNPPVTLVFTGGKLTDKK